MELKEEVLQNLCDIMLGEKIPLDIVNAYTGVVIIPANRKITKTLLREVVKNHQQIDIDPSPIRNKIREILGSFEHKLAELGKEGT